MSKEYIDKSKLLDDVDILISKEQEQGNINSALYALQFVKALIDSTSAADVVEVVHGKWKFQRMTGEKSYWSSCSNCGILRWFEDSGHEQHYCDYCGAKMDGGRKES